jgi:hypothetical protein
MASKNLEAQHRPAISSNPAWWPRTRLQPIEKKVKKGARLGLPNDCYQLPNQTICRQSLVKQLGLKNDPWI